MTDKSGTEETRDRLIQAGLTLFGRNGFDGATTRQICELANANISAIPYYFNSKEGLYRAVVGHIRQSIEAVMAPAVIAIEGEFAASGLEPDRAKAMLKLMVANACTLLVGSKEAEKWAAIILREQMTPTFAFDVLYEGFMKRMLGAISTLIAAIKGKDPEDPAVLLTAMTVMGQVLVFRVARAAVLRRMGWTDIGPDQLADIQTLLSANIDALFDGHVGSAA